MTTDAELVDRLRANDSSAFREVVAMYQPMLVRVAEGFVPSRAVAEEVAQETWIAVIKGIDRFEGRSSLKTWIVRILVNIARTKGARERRTVPFASFAGEDEAAVSPERFVGPPGRGGWLDPPAHWSTLPEKVATSRETLSTINETIEALPEQQRRVVELRDVAGWSSAEVCEALALTEANQRVLLHRGRSWVRAALEAALGTPA